MQSIGLFILLGIFLAMSADAGIARRNDDTPSSSSISTMILPEVIRIFQNYTKGSFDLQGASIFSSMIMYL